MWIIFIAVVLVLSFLMVFLMVAIRTLTAQARGQLNQYFLKNLETYDRLAENKSKEIEELQKELSVLEARKEGLQERLEVLTRAGANAGEERGASGKRRSIAGAGQLSAPTGKERDTAFLSEYSYIRRYMGLDYRKIVEDMLYGLAREESPDVAFQRDMLEKMPKDRLYDLMVLTEDDQIAYLKSVFDEREGEFLDDYLLRQAPFDILKLREELEGYVKSHEDRIYIRTGIPKEYEGIGGNRVEVIFDAGVHEGVRVSYKNKVYDYAV